MLEGAARTVCILDLPVFSELVKSCALTIFDQCMYGKQSRKPTMILWQGCDARALQNICTHAQRHMSVTQSKTTDGKYATSRLAAYPPALNEALAAVIARAIVGKIQRVLIMFSGKSDQSDNLAECLARLNIQSVQLDIVNWPSCDLLRDDHFGQVLDILEGDEVSFVFGAPPCRTFSLARTVSPGPPVLRDRENPRAFSAEEMQDRGIPEGEVTKARHDTVLAERTALVLSSAQAKNIGFMMEHPWPWMEEQQMQRPSHVSVQRVAPSYDGMPLGVKIWHALKHFEPTGAPRFVNLAKANSPHVDGYSEMLGLNVALQVSAATVKNPALFALCMEFLASCKGTECLEVTSIQVNKNFLSQPHRDKANAGLSALIAFGAYTGGDLLYWPHDDGGDEFQKTPFEKRNARQLQLFDGNKLHATDDFEGERYSLVFFKVRGAENTELPVQRELCAMGARCDDWQTATL